MSTLISLSMPAYALGVGAAEVGSSIGQQLSVRIPIFNVANPNLLQIKFKSEQFGATNQVKVTAALDRSNSQLAIKLSSDKVVNEPYLTFALNLVDAETELAKDFTVLLNLASQGRISKSQSDNNSLRIFNTRDSQHNIVVSSSFIASTMGPYDTAIAGDIRQRFGAVLDGQSLWRVARRINKAMGVSRNQMMWALYQANPGAFTSQSIESLRAGSYLNIPSQSIVAQVSDSQAKANMQALSRGDLARSQLATQSNSDGQLSSVTDNAKVSLGQSILSEPTDAIAVAEIPLNQDLFQVTSISLPAGTQSPQAPSTLAQAQTVIASLTEAVVNITQQLEQKNNTIEFLEERVQELTLYIKTEELPTSVLATTPLTQGSEQYVDSSFESTKMGVIKQIDNQMGKNWFQSKSTWALMTLLILSFVIYGAWAWIKDLVYSLNLFGRQETMEFSIAELQKGLPVVRNADTSRRAPAVTDDISFGLDDSLEAGTITVHENSSDEHGFHEADSISFAESQDEVAPNFDHANAGSLATLEHSKPKRGGGRDSEPSQIKRAFDKPSQKDEMVETIELLADEISARENNIELSFEKRFEHFLHEEAFDSARELLDFARNNEISDDRYHFERLRLLEKMNNEEDFYEYYYSIEDKIHDFPQMIQAQISLLVVQLALV